MSLRFVADGMLGTLAKWLRVLGYDTLFDPALNDNQLVRLARAEGRVLLTRDRELARRRGLTYLLILSQNLDEQILQVLAEAASGTAPSDADVGRPAPRCPVCNEALQAIDLETARTRVPPYVAHTQTVFSQCPTCQRIYWRGTHWEHMEQYLTKIQR